ncbi:hypothetical protein FPV67DRAFT_932446 [Lyophyllum atratum]|nr:hypothetical protein FPV67DRAFT_932446 [Lyophyllum atratum]
MSTLRNPRETIVRQVFVYPANGNDPHVTGMKFSEAGANHRKGLYTTAVDLRALYGKSLYSGVGYTTVGIENQPDKTEIEGDYMVYYNLDLKLPLNLALARLVGINPKRPGSRPTWRGDVVVVKSREWPGPLIMGGGAHMDWLNVSPAVEGSLEIFFKRWYASKEWELKIEEERSILEIFKQPRKRRTIP